MNQRFIVGRIGEELVAGKYLAQGYNIVGRNVRLHGTKQFGEIDLIVSKGHELVFVEVKTRRSEVFGFGAEAVDRRKQLRLIRAAQLYLQHNKRFLGWPWRFDVAEVRIDKNPASVIIFVNVIEDLD